MCANGLGHYCACTQPERGAYGGAQALQASAAPTAGRPGFSLYIASAHRSLPVRRGTSRREPRAAMDAIGFAPTLPAPTRRHSLVVSDRAGCQHECSSGPRAHLTGFWKENRDGKIAIACCETAILRCCQLHVGALYFLRHKVGPADAAWGVPSFHLANHALRSSLHRATVLHIRVAARHARVQDQQGPNPAQAGGAGGGGSGTTCTSSAEQQYTPQPRPAAGHSRSQGQEGQAGAVQ